MLNSEKDLTEAAEVLPSRWPSSYLGRATKGMANALLAKLYLYQENGQKRLNYQKQ